MNSCFLEFFELLRDDSEQICFHLSLIPCGVLGLFKRPAASKRSASILFAPQMEAFASQCFATARRQTWTRPQTCDHPTRMIESPTC